MILVGHSLGGGIAQVIAARLGHQALVFSAPGILYSSQRFGIYNRTYWNTFYRMFGDGPDASLAASNALGRPNPQTHGTQNAKRLITVVIPDYDKVPRIDKQLGIVQRIECRACHKVKVGETCERNPESHFREFGSIASCHSLNRTACELWRVCGDEYQRSWDCDSHVSAADIGREFNPDDPD